MRKPKRQNLRNNLQDHNKVVSKADNIVVSKVVPSNIDRKDQMGLQSKDDCKAIEKKVEELQTELQQYMYSQSSKFSSVSRNLIFGIMGTIWAFSFAKGENLYNPWFLFSLLCCFIYLMLDVCHYFSDTNSYNKEQYVLDKCTTLDDLSKHEIVMDKINKRSNKFIHGKFWILVTTSISFFIGAIIQVGIYDWILLILKSIISSFN